MSIVDFQLPPAPAATSSRRHPYGQFANGEPKPKAKTWLNVGYMANGRFINLPLGLPIDTMEAADVRGQNQEFVAQRNAQNALLKWAQDVGAKLQPGEEIAVNLITKIRRVNEDLVVAPEDNAFAIDFTTLLPAAE